MTISLREIFNLIVGDISVRATNVNLQSIANNTQVTLIFPSTEEFDTNNLHDVSTNNSRLTPSSTGKWLIFAHIGFLPNSTGFRLVRITANNGAAPGAIAAQVVPAKTTGAGDQTCSVTTVMDLTPSDFVEVKVIQDSGGALSVRGSSAAGKETGNFGMIRLA